jgi:hypothetical protein
LSRASPSPSPPKIFSAALARRLKDGGTVWSISLGSHQVKGVGQLALCGSGLPSPTVENKRPRMQSAALVFKHTIDKLGMGSVIRSAVRSLHTGFGRTTRCRVWGARLAGHFSVLLTKTWSQRFQIFSQAGSGQTDSGISQVVPGLRGRLGTAGRRLVRVGAFLSFCRGAI